MSIILYTASPTVPHLPGGAVPKTSQAFTKDTLVDRDVTNAYVKPSTAATTTNMLFAVYVGATVTTASSSPANLDVIPVLNGPQQLWIVDCTNNTAADQLYKGQLLTNSGTVANTSTAIIINTGIFIPIAIIGVATDKKLLGYFCVHGQINAAS